MTFLHHRPAHRAWLAVSAGVPLAVGAVAWAADPPSASRDELVRKWDVNSDGTIDAAEAELARSRMRRERAELLFKTGIDPLTGRPRTLAADPAADDLPAELPEAGPPRPKPGQPSALPGTRVPETVPPIPSVESAPKSPGQRAGDPRRTPGRDARNAEATADDDPRTAGRDPRGSGQPPRGPAVVTGGARAGAPARPGYGSTIPVPDLNAGRLPAGLPGRPATSASGGLLPRLRRPSPAAPVPSVQPPRRTVDDFNVY